MEGLGKGVVAGWEGGGMWQGLLVGKGSVNCCSAQPAVGRFDMKYCTLS